MLELAKSPNSIALSKEVAELPDLIALGDSIISSDESAMPYSGHLHICVMTELTGTAARYFTLA